MTLVKKNKSSYSGPSIDELMVQFNFEPTRQDLFIEAFTHSSFANEHQLNSNERLEFLGDSVFSLIVCEYLYKEYPTFNEGDLAKLKSVVISTQILASFAKQIGLDRYLRLSQGEIRTNGYNKQNILADLFEAFTGAYFLNFGLAKTVEFVIPLVSKLLPEIAAQYNLIDAKTSLQELAQSQGTRPDYRVVKEEGPPHNKTFTVEVLFRNQVIGQGIGKTLKEAQNIAARSGIQYLKKS